MKYGDVLERILSNKKKLIENNKILQIQEEKETGTCEVSAAENFINLI